MFFSFFLKSFRILLLPFALLYWAGIALRNWLYHKKIFTTTRFGLPLICVGNLAVGGTGKSPMVEYLLRLLKDQYATATLSRGYKRRTKGYALAGPGTTALDIGDEPMQFHLKFPEVAVAVGEERVEAIPQLLHDCPGTEVVVLDDAFQHRAIEAGLNILLTECSNLFTRDFYLPTGDLRDLKSGYKRADIIVVTKCKSSLTEAEKQDIIHEIKLLPHQQIFFTTLQYGQLYHAVNKNAGTMGPGTEVLLVTGIANPRPLKLFLEEQVKSYHLLQYADHHIFTIDDLKEIKKKFAETASPDKVIVTTEKDAVRLIKFSQEIQELPLYILPVRHHFLFQEGAQFDALIHSFIRNFQKPEQQQS